MKKSCFFSIFFFCFSACVSSGIPSSELVNLDSKLYNTEWNSKKSARKKSYITFTQGYIELQVGNVLGSEKMPLYIVEQDFEYVLYKIFPDQQPMLLGVFQVDSYKIKVLWGSGSSLTNSTEQIKQLLKDKGTEFSLTKKLKNK